MKHNPKETVNIVTLVEEFVATLNSQCVEHKVQKHYDISIKEGRTEGKTDKLKKTLKFVVSNLDTNERVTLFELDYNFTNPAKILSDSYKRTLYREFLYNSVGVFAFNIEQNIVQKNLDAKLGNQETFDPTLGQRPLTQQEVADLSTAENYAISKDS